MLNATATATVPDVTPAWLLIVLAVLGVLTAINTLLHLVAKHTKTQLDDEAASYLDRFLAWARTLLGKVNPLTTIAVVALAAVAASAVSCGPKSTETLHALGGCAAKSAEDAVLPEVESVLKNGAADSWKNMLEALAVAYGKDLILCTVADVAQLEAAKQGGDIPASQAVARAKAYLAENGYQ